MRVRLAPLIRLLPIGLLLCLVFSPITPARAATTYYVAAGSSGNGSSANPFGTIQQCATVAVAGDTCVIRSGIYRETVTPNSGVTFQPDTSATVTVSGADPVGGWTQHSGNIYRASVALNSNLKANQVFVGETMQLLARWPNTSVTASLLQPNWATAGAGSALGVINDASMPNIDWSGAIVRVFGGTNPYANQTGTVTSSSSGQVRFDTPNWNSCPMLCSAPGARYILIGKLAALDSPGEWFYDAGAQQLYLWSSAGGVPSNVTVKQRDYAFDLRGRSNVTIQGLNLFASTIVMDDASRNNVIDGVRAKFLSHFDYFGGNILDTRDTGIILKGSGHIVRNSVLEYSAGNGVLLGGNGSTVTNNLIHDMGYAGNYATAITVPTENNPSGHTITNNTIYNTGRDGISISWYGTQGNTVQNVNIAYNRIYNYARTASDAGGIYACCYLAASNSTIHHNWIYGSQIIDGLFPSSGIYIDDYSGGFDIYQNVVWDTKGIGIVVKESASRHLVTNNTLIRSQMGDRGAGLPRGIAVLGSSVASGTRIENNKTTNEVFATYSGAAIPNLTVSGNGPNATGANEGINATVGCNLSGCSGDSPLAFGERAFSATRKIEAESFLGGDQSTLSMLFDRIGVNAPVNDVVLRYPNVDFGSGVSSFSYNVGVNSSYAGGKVEVRIDSASGTLLGTLTIADTGGFDAQVTQSIPVQSASGVHDLYLVLKGSNSGGVAAAGNVDWISFGAGGGGGTTYRSATSQIEAESENAQQGVTDFGTGIGSIDAGDWLRYDLDFGSGVSSFTANVAVPAEYAGRQIQVRLDSTTGTVIGTLTVQNTGGWNNYQQQTVSLSQTATGQRSLYLTFAGGNGVGNLDWIRFGAAGGGGTTGGGTTYRSATSQIEAESENAQQGVTDFGTGIGSIDAGDWLRYDLDFGSGVSSFTANVAVPAEYAGRQIQVRLDSTTGTVIGTLTVQNTGGWNNYQQQTVSLSQTATGQRSLYLTFAGGNGVGNLDWIRFGAAGPLASVEAERYSSQSGVNNFGTGIGSLDTNDWAAYSGVNLGAGATRIEFRIAVDACCAGKQVEVRQGSTTGTLLGTLTVQNTGGWSSYTTQSTTLSGASGTQTIYLVFKGGNGVGNLDWFKIY